MIFADVAPFLWVFGSLAVGYIFLHKFADVIKEKFKAMNRASNTATKDKDVDAQINDLVKNAPTIRDQVKTEIDKLKAEGVTDEQLKGLNAKKQMLDFVADNSQIINLFAKPILKRVMGMIKL